MNQINVVLVYLETITPMIQWKIYLVANQLLQVLIKDFCFVFLVHTTRGSSALSPYLNFDPKFLNTVE